MPTAESGHYELVCSFSSPASGGSDGPCSTGGFGGIWALISKTKLATDLCMAYQTAKSTIPAISVIIKMIKNA